MPESGSLDGPTQDRELKFLEAMCGHGPLRQLAYRSLQKKEPYKTKIRGKAVEFSVKSLAKFFEKTVGSETTVERPKVPTLLKRQRTDSGNSPNKVADDPTKRFKASKTTPRASDYASQYTKNIPNKNDSPKNMRRNLGNAFVSGLRTHAERDKSQTPRRNQNLQTNGLKNQDQNTSRTAQSNVTSSNKIQNGALSRQNSGFSSNFAPRVPKVPTASSKTSSTTTSADSNNNQDTSASNSSASSATVPPQQSDTSNKPKNIDAAATHQKQSNTTSEDITARVLSKISDYREYFEHYNIPYYHLREKPEFVALKRQFEELKSTLSAESAAESLRAEIDSQMKTSTTANSSEQEQPAQASANQNQNANSAQTGGATTAKSTTASTANNNNQSSGVSGTNTSGNNFPTMPASKEQETISDASRIMKIQEYGSWAYQVLGLNWRTAEFNDVGKQFRLLMRKLHPDKLVGMSGNHQELLSAAMDKIKRAKNSAEDEISRRDFSPPEMIRGIQHTVISSVPGKRVYNLKWQPSITNDSIPPTEKYHVQAFDPKYGKYLHITIIEGDYCQETKRFRDINELNSYKIEESGMGKLRHIFDEPQIKLQVAAQNKIGMGTFALYTIRQNKEKDTNQQMTFAPLPMPQRSGGFSSTSSRFMDPMQRINQNQNSSSSTTSFTMGGTKININISASASFSTASSLGENGGRQNLNINVNASSSSGSNNNVQERLNSMTKKEKSVFEFEKKAKEIFTILRSDEARLHWITQQGKMIKKDFLKLKGWPHTGGQQEIDTRLMSYCKTQYGI